MHVDCPSCKARVDFNHVGDDIEVVCPGCDHISSIATAMRNGVLDEGMVLGGYEIRRLLGTGGMAKVYEAIQVSLQRRVALKVIVASMAGSELMAKRFLLEVRATASLEHSSIVTVFEASEEDGLLYLAMELVEGKTLEDVAVDSGGRIPERDAWACAAGVIKAMDYAWRYQKLLHRDIKPANIMVLDDGQIKICDLGIAKRPDDDYQVSKKGIAIGTPYFMSPEQAQGKTDLDFRSDVYSLGATLFRLITGRLPFEGDSSLEVITKHIVENTPKPNEVYPDVSDESAALISLMMLKDPRQRHKSWVELLEDVERVMEGEMPMHDPVPTPTRDEVESMGPGGYQRTLVDMGSIEQEFRRTGLSTTVHSKDNGMVLLRMALWMALLVASTGFFSYQFRDALFPSVFATVEPPLSIQPPLLLDDGASPAPPAVTAEPIREIVDERGRHVPELVEKLPDSPAAKELVATLDRCIAEGISPIALAREAYRLDRRQLAMRIYYLVMVGDGSWNGDHRVKALMDSADILRTTGESAKLAVLFDRAVAVAAKLPPPHGALPYLGKAELYWQELKTVDAHRTLHQGAGRFLKSKRTEDAGVLATALLRSLEHRGDQGRLYQYCGVVLESFPQTTAVAKLAATLMKELTPPPQVALPIPEDRMATRFELGGILEKLRNGSTERELLPEIVVYYGRNGEAGKVNDYLEYADRTYPQGNGETTGRCLLALAEEYRVMNDLKLRVDALERVAFGMHHGSDGKLGVLATTALADHYLKADMPVQWKRVVALQTTVLAGFDATTASKQLLALAKADIADGRVEKAYRKLYRVAMHLGNKALAKEAEGLVDTLGRTKQKALETAKKQEYFFGPFEAVISPSPDGFSRMTVAVKNGVPSNSVAIEFWYAARSAKEPFMTISDTSNTLAISHTEQGLSLRLPSGTRVPANTPETREWRHVAIQLSKQKGLTLFVDGKLVAERPLAPILSVQKVVFSGDHRQPPAIQNLVIRKGAHFQKPFTPRTTMPPLKQATVALTATAFGIHEFMNNRVTYGKSN